jgi:hypothetical protein
MLAAMALLVVAGTAQELLHLAGRENLGALIVVPALLAVFWLWRPPLVAIAAILLVLGLEALLPLQTGGGMVVDWVRHWEIGLSYAGRPSHVTQAYLASRTALSEQILAALLAHQPGYWMFQVGSALLNCLCLWPAAVIIRRRAPDHVALRLLGVVLVPIVLYFGVYTWPWALAAFFILCALACMEDDGPMAAAAVGLGLAGALLVHPGSLGYVLGLAVYVVARRRGLVPVALVVGILAIAIQLPWVVSVTAGHGPLSLVTSSDPGQARVPVWVYLLTRPLLVVHTLVPFPPLVPGLEVPDVVMSFFVHSLPGALGAALVLAPRLLRPRGPAWWMAGVGVPVTLLIYPADIWLVGIVEGLFLLLLVLLVDAAAAASSGQARRLLVANAGLAVVFTAVALWIAWAAPASDPNVVLRSRYGVVYLESLLGPLPGILLLAGGVFACWYAVARRPDPAPTPIPAS